MPKEQLTFGLWWKPHAVAALLPLGIKFKTYFAKMLSLKFPLFVLIYLPDPKAKGFDDHDSINKKNVIMEAVPSVKKQVNHFAPGIDSKRL